MGMQSDIKYLLIRFKHFALIYLQIQQQITAVSHAINNSRAKHSIFELKVYTAVQGRIPPAISYVEASLGWYKETSYIEFETSIFTVWTFRPILTATKVLYSTSWKQIVNHYNYSIKGYCLGIRYLRNSVHTNSLSKFGDHFLISSWRKIHGNIRG